MINVPANLKIFAFAGILTGALVSLIFELNREFPADRPQESGSFHEISVHDIPSPRDQYDCTNCHDLTGHPEVSPAPKAAFPGPSAPSRTK